MNSSLHGLILIGGKSQRMGQDKHLLDYHGETQLTWLQDLLSPFCQKVFVSAAQETHLQLDDSALIIRDKLPGSGPLIGILSAMIKVPHAAFFVVACDLPFLDSPNLKKLINERDQDCLATGFYNSNKKWVEPLATIYEPKIFSEMFKDFSLPASGPRKFLAKQLPGKIKNVMPIHQNVFINANNQFEYQQIKKNFMGPNTPSTMFHSDF
jgi:molybdopterin-guanine dinucleotide biosynthesis protein A